MTPEILRAAETLHRAAGELKHDDGTPFDPLDCMAALLAAASNYAIWLNGKPYFKGTEAMTDFGVVACTSYGYMVDVICKTPNATLRDTPPRDRRNLRSVPMRHRRQR